MARSPLTGDPQQRLEQKETGRVEAFSDGVFGIAITLLALDIKVPPAGTTALGAALLRQWPVYLAYLISFLTVLIMWMNHHKLFQHIHRVDHLFLILNGLLLMSITVVPFPTSLLAAYVGGGEARIAAAVYSGWFVMIAILFNLLWRYACHRGRLLARDYDRARVDGITRQYRFGPLMYAAALGLAFVNVAASVGLCLALAVFFAIPESRR
jgi:uncharacterized membrane protein